MEGLHEQVGGESSWEGASGGAIRGGRRPNQGWFLAKSGVVGLNQGTKSIGGKAGALTSKLSCLSRDLSLNLLLLLT